MKSVWQRSSILGLVAAAVMPATALADSISPTFVEASIGVGESITIRKTVTVDEGGAGRVDVYFLTDSTGSMSGEIAAVKAAAGAIPGSIDAGDVAFGAGEYRDLGDAYIVKDSISGTVHDGGGNAFAGALTTDLAAGGAFDTAVGTWAAGGGGDFEEAQLIALTDVATATAWRPGSERLVVWFGDAPGHEDPEAGYPSRADVIADMNAEGIAVLAIDVGSMDSSGQATDIAAGTGGSLTVGVSEATIVAAINDAIAAAVASYSTVELEAVGVDPSIVSVMFSPASIVGAFDRSVTETFEFDMTITGVGVGTDAFVVNALVDGGIVATERDLIDVPEPATIGMLGLGMVAFGAAARRRRSAA